MGRSHAANVSPPTNRTPRAKLAGPNIIGALDHDRRFVQSASKFFLPFTNAFYGLFTGWICEINPKDSGNVPSGVPAYFMSCAVLKSGKLHPSYPS